MYTFRKAICSDKNQIWNILKFAIHNLKESGSNQWQDGYPNLGTVQSDIDKGYAYVVTDEIKILMYVAIQFEPEPTYESIEGAWLTETPYCVIHRMAASPKSKGNGLSKVVIHEAATLAQLKGVDSIRIDTHPKNKSMLHILEKLKFARCGIISVRNEPRIAFEKLL